MPAPITVIIPTLNTAATLGPTLASVFAGVETGLVNKVIFADGGSTDGIAELAEDTGAELITSAPGRGTQLAIAAKTVHSPWMLVLHADTTLSDDWPDLICQHIQSCEKAAYFRLRFNATGIAPRIVEAWANLRSKTFGLPYGDQGLLIPTGLYAQIDGYPDIPLMEDVVIARSLKGHLMPLPVIATTSADKYQSQGWIERGGRNLLTLVRFLLGASPEALAKRYNNRG